GGGQLNLAVEAKGATTEAPRLEDTRVEEAAAEPPALAGGAEPHALELTHAGFEHAHRGRAHYLPGRIDHEEQHAAPPVVLLLPVGDVVVEPFGIEGVADEGQIFRELSRDGGIVCGPRAPGDEAGRHAPLRACEARPRSHRYSASPPFLATQRESTKRRSLSRLT